MSPTLKTTDPDKVCAEHQRVSKDTEAEPPFYKVPFWWGPEPRFAPEWWCEECVYDMMEEDDEFMRIENGVVLMDINGDGEFLNAEEAEERYLDGTLFET